MISRTLINLSTEVITRTKIDNETGTVEGGALFTEEYLPAESIMYSLLLATDEFTNKLGKMEAQDVVNFFNEKIAQREGIVQIGGDATLGKGITRIAVL